MILKKCKRKWKTVFGVGKLILKPCILIVDDFNRINVATNYIDNDMFRM